MNRIAEDPRIVDQDVGKERMAICKACPHLKALDRCEICGCFMTIKVYFANVRCPLPEPKWIEYGITKS